MQYLQPMHFSLSTNTTFVSGSRYYAPVVHTCVQGESAHCWHIVGSG